MMMKMEVKDATGREQTADLSRSRSRGRNALLVLDESPVASASCA
jgi:hypothetical protein